jgi:hypothetical protein
MTPVTTGAKEKLRRHGWTRGAKYLVVHRRPDYPLAGCVPAEPASVSPGDGNVTKRHGEKQGQPCKRGVNQYTPEPRWARFGCRGGSLLDADYQPPSKAIRCNK